VAFVDRRKVGAAMFVGSLQAGSLDALVPHDPGSIDLGTIAIDDGRAHPSATTSEVIAALGLDPAVAERLGASDDLATRYANPDVDNDGMIDALEPSADFRLDLFADLRVTITGHDATLDDLLRGAMTGSDVGVDYRDTGIVMSMPRSYAHDFTAAAMTFEGDYYGSMLGGATPVVPAGTAIGAPELELGTVDGYPSVAVFARAGHDLPRGTYTLAAGDRVFAFADVRPPADADLAGGHGLVVPFMQIAPVAPGCTADCRLDSISYTWMRSTADGWVAADASEVVHPAHLDVVRQHAGTLQYLGADLPAVPSASVAWQQMTSDTMSPAELAGITTAELCYFAVTYDDQVGMRVTSRIANPACYPF